MRFVMSPACLERGELFNDEEFPPDDASLFFSERQYGIEWKRPHEICDEVSSTQYHTGAQK